MDCSIEVILGNGEVSTVELDETTCVVGKGVLVDDESAVDKIIELETEIILDVVEEAGRVVTGKRDELSVTTPVVMDVFVDVILDVVEAVWLDNGGE